MWILGLKGLIESPIRGRWEEASKYMTFSFHFVCTYFVCTYFLIK